MNSINPWSFLSMGIFFHILFAYSKALHVRNWVSKKAIPSSYYRIAAGNVLRCERLCGRQMNCVAVTFDSRQRMCYMHDIHQAVIATRVPTGDNKRYLFKTLEDRQAWNYKAIDSQCDKGTQLLIPTASKKGDSCHKLAETEALFECPPSAISAGYRFKDKFDICYRLGTDNVGWDDAERICNKEGGHLILVNNSAVHFWIIDLFKTRKISYERLFIDGNDKDTEGVFKNYRNETLTWTMWGRKDPNNSKDNEHCVTMSDQIDSVWFDVPCDNFRSNKKYMCQIDTRF